METQALGSAPRQGHVLPTGCVCTLVQMFQLGFISTFSFSPLRLFLLVLSSWEHPSVGHSFCCYCLDAFVFFFPFFLVFSFYSSFLLLLQVFLDIQNTFSFSPASAGQMATREMCRWLKQMFVKVKIFNSWIPAGLPLMNSARMVPGTCVAPFHIALL